MGTMLKPFKRKHPNALKEIYETMQAAGTRVVAVGYPIGLAQAYPDGTPVAEVAAQNVFGDPPKIPARDFMSQARPDMIRHQREVAEKNSVVLGQTNTLLAALGEYAVGDIKRAIINGSYAPLADATIEARKEKGNKSTKPLIDTHHMIDSTIYVVRDKE
jgi:hypothetical protein